MLNKRKAGIVFKILSEAIPIAKTELNYNNLFTLLVAVMLSAQSKDSSVNIATAQLFKIVNSPKDMINLGYDKLIEHIKTIGLYKNKASNILNTSKILIENFNGIVPNNFDDLITLPGVGRKTANVILNVYFKQPTMPVDTHVFRLANRIGLSHSNNLLQVEHDLLNIIPKDYLQTAHHLLILHGRYTCKAKGYNCTLCQINKHCEKNI